MKNLRYFSLFLIFIMLAALLTGCGDSQAVSDSAVSGSVVSGSAVSDSVVSSSVVSESAVSDTTVVSFSELGLEGDEAEAARVVWDNIRALAEHDIDGYMLTISADSEQYADTRAQVEKMLSIYAIGVEVKSLEVVSISGDSAVIEVEQITARYELETGAGRTTRSLLEHTMARKDGAWVIMSTVCKNESDIKPAAPVSDTDVQ